MKEKMTSQDDSFIWQGTLEIISGVPQQLTARHVSSFGDLKRHMGQPKNRKRTLYGLDSTHFAGEHKPIVFFDDNGAVVAHICPNKHGFNISCSVMEQAGLYPDHFFRRIAKIDAFTAPLRPWMYDYISGLFDAFGDAHSYYHLTKEQLADPSAAAMVGLIATFEERFALVRSVPAWAGEFTDEDVSEALRSLVDTAYCSERAGRKGEYDEHKLRWDSSVTNLAIMRRGVQAMLLHFLRQHNQGEEIQKIGDILYGAFGDDRTRDGLQMFMADMSANNALTEAERAVFNTWGGDIIKSWSAEYDPENGKHVSAGDIINDWRFIAALGADEQAAYYAKQAAYVAAHPARWTDADYVVLANALPKHPQADEAGQMAGVITARQKNAIENGEQEAALKAIKWPAKWDADAFPAAIETCGPTDALLDKIGARFGRNAYAEALDTLLATPWLLQGFSREKWAQPVFTLLQENDSKRLIAVLKKAREADGLGTVPDDILNAAALCVVRNGTFEQIDELFADLSSHTSFSTRLDRRVILETAAALFTRRAPAAAPSEQPSLLGQISALLGLTQRPQAQVQDGAQTRLLRTLSNHPRFSSVIAGELLAQAQGGTATTVIDFSGAPALPFALPPTRPGSPDRGGGSGSAPAA